MSIRRLFVTKRATFAQEANRVLQTIQKELSIPATSVTIYERYDIDGLTDDQFETAKELIFSEPPIDIVSNNISIPEGALVVSRESIPGQYDQRSDSAEQCLAMLTLQSGAKVRTARIYVITGTISEKEADRIRKFYINPVDSRQASLAMPSTLDLTIQPAAPVPIIDGFTNYTESELNDFIQKLGLAMTLADLKLIQTYFKDQEKRNPTMTEIRVLDTYWSDHCRHTTFMTELTDITIDDDKRTQPIKQALADYMAGRAQIYQSRQKARTLMDMATLAVKELRAQGGLQEIDESDEINACTIVVPVDVDGKKEEWLLLFKNETHNHPTEIEPYGGAATCLGGCIRDPLSGRAYVYQAMRVTGAANPLTPIEDTLQGKLPQRQITTGAAKGYSSYGNQIGLATGEVHEYYHPGYVAKRMEIGAVIGAAPRKNVRREEPKPGDIVVLLGGKTGRDGCGGATGSSKEHTLESLETCGAEVQKGNPLTERKIQRLFRRPEVTTLIKRCNDFGAGGVSVAIGELTDGLDINLDRVPKKYEGLDGTELAISESQERMACVIAASHWPLFASYCDEENLEATIVADVTDTNRLVMHWQGTTIVDISRTFLNTNGATQKQTAHITAPQGAFFDQALTDDTQDINKRFIKTVKNLAVTSQQGLAECFDSTIGAGTVLMPFSGRYQKTPVQGMVAKLPVLSGKTKTVSIMTHGFHPYLSAWSPFHGAQYAIALSIAKLVALGGDRTKAYLTMQEYFERLHQNSLSWGKPAAALLGAYTAQKALGIGAIGGKDSMSGTFMDKTVPPTLVSFAVTTEDIDTIVSPDLKEAGHQLLLFTVPQKTDDTINWAVFKSHCDTIHKEMLAKRVYASYVLENGGLAEALVKMALGNQIGVHVNDAIDTNDLFSDLSASILLEVDGDTAKKLLTTEYVSLIGTTTDKATIQVKDTILSLADLQAAYESTLAPIFPLHAPSQEGEAVAYIHNIHKKAHAPIHMAKPKVVIPVFPGTNCEYDSARAFSDVGGDPQIVIIRNQTIEQLNDSIRAMKQAVDSAQILFFPGGFSAGDEPDGSGKFMATLFRNPYLKESLENLLYQRDGLALGICNGFQALIKLGLLPNGHVEPLTKNSPTLTHNTIGRHLSGMVRTKIISTKSPWMSAVQAGNIYTVAISHGEGRFIASPEQVVQFNKNGQIATQYVDENGVATYDARYNPNQSVAAIEGLFSPDGRVFGKMAHIERAGYGISKNVPGKKVMPVFESGVKYFQ